jgi:hypothetical protein
MSERLDSVRKCAKAKKIAPADLEEIISRGQFLRSVTRIVQYVAPFTLD